MPIERTDGRHWCAPADEPDAGSDWTCPGCGRHWNLVHIDSVPVWEDDEQQKVRLDHETTARATDAESAAATPTPEPTKKPRRKKETS